jgi:Tfp pilus assembly protein PilF
MDEKANRRRDKLLEEAAGYIVLEMYAHALAAVDRIPLADRGTFKVQMCRGYLLRHLKRHEEALESFHRAFEEKPNDVDLLLAMAWCYKRTNQLSRAISSMERAYQIAPKDATVLYNLACYWSLAGNKTQCLSWLGRALRMSSGLIDLIDTESDFEPLRKDPDFQKLVGMAKGVKS